MLLKDSVVTIVGMGLMGGSLGMALMHSRACKQVRGLVRRNETAESAIEKHAAHIAGMEPGEILPKSDIVVFAVPVLSIEDRIEQYKSYYEPHTIVTDLGSVKRGIVKAMESCSGITRAVGGHPMCGKEKSGLVEADENLYRNRSWVVVPTTKCDEDSVDTVVQLILSAGANPVFMNAEDHDRSVGCISHLPYMMASTLVAVADDTGHELPEIWTLAAGGFRDTSRVAAGDLDMMMDILVANRDNILGMLSVAETKMKRLSTLLESKDYDELRIMLSGIKSCRSKLN